MNLSRHFSLALYRQVYESGIRRLIFRQSASDAHQTLLKVLKTADESPLLRFAARAVHRLVFMPEPVQVGGVNLSFPLILAAGLVKGEGFASETDALIAVHDRKNIMPGWRIMPLLVGAVEFGSFTRYPRLGNPGHVIWRDEPTRSTQNRVGLRNPGAAAAAEFLTKRPLPPVFGVNIAISPGVTDADQERYEVLDALTAFISRRVIPSWFTLNLSCPNTEDDPGSHQTAGKTHALCTAVLNHLRASGCVSPLWIKLSPDLAPEQYIALMRVFAEVGVRAVIVTNTLPHPSPDDPALLAGIGGGALHTHALAAAAVLSDEKAKHSYSVDIIGCGGVLDGQSYRAFRHLGIVGVQYWSALVYRGPLAAALIHSEAQYDSN
jgi:dihydroorotate dehydrogenase